MIAWSVKASAKESYNSNTEWKVPLQLIDKVMGPWHWRNCLVSWLAHRCKSRNNLHPDLQNISKWGHWHAGIRHLRVTIKITVYLTTEHQSTHCSGSRLHFIASHYWTSDRAVKQNKDSSVRFASGCQKELPRSIKWLSQKEPSTIALL